MNLINDKTGGASPNRFSGIRILLVNETGSDRDKAAAGLVALGCELALSENATQALDLLRNTRFDLVLIDAHWMVAEGESMVQRFKQDSRGTHLPIIVLASPEQTPTLASCLQAGVDDYLLFPFHPVLWSSRLQAGLDAARWHDQERSWEKQIAKEKKRTSDLCRVIFPEHVANELEETQGVEPRRFERVGVLFCAVPGFASYCDRHPPAQGVRQFQSLVEMFELLTLQHDLEKIKTIGGAFMAVTGLPEPVNHPALTCVRAGLAMIGAAQSMPPQWNVRAGVHVGSAVAGVVGHRKYQFDVWGETVAWAAALEKAAQPGTVCVRGDLWPSLAEHCEGRSDGSRSIHGCDNQELFLIESLLA